MYFSNLTRRQKELKHFRDTNIGLYCIDQDPSSVEYSWIVDNAFRLE